MLLVSWPGNHCQIQGHAALPCVLPRVLQLQLLRFGVWSGFFPMARLHCSQCTSPATLNFIEAALVPDKRPAASDSAALPVLPKPATPAQNELACSCLCAERRSKCLSRYAFFFPRQMLKRKTIALLKLVKELMELDNSVWPPPRCAVPAAHRGAPSPKPTGHWKGALSMSGKDL